MSAFLCQAQSVSPLTISSGSNEGIAGSLHFSWNIGELITELPSGDPQITFGVLQPLSATTNSPLPVSGIELKVKRISENKVQLDWKTIQETNNKGFYVERKMDNENSFVQVGFVPSKSINGNSDTPLTYQFVNNDNYSGKSYYRLRQEDVDGTISYSAVEMVQGLKGKNVQLTSYPNPSTGAFSVLIESDEQNTGHPLIQIFDISGRLIRQLNAQHNVPVKFYGLHAGIYIIKLAGNNELYVKQIIQ
jgi:hypothetical protein